MSNQNDNNTQVLDPEAVNSQEQAQTEVVADEAAAATEVPVVKTKKELKKERKEIKKHKKAVKKEAKKHSAKATKAQKFLITVLTLIVIVCMVWCSYMAITITQNMMGSGTASSDTAVDADSDSADADTAKDSAQSAAPSDSSNSNATDSGSEETTAANAEDNSDASGENTDSSAAASTGALSTKEEIVEYYKTAHAKVLSEAASVTRTYDNVTNYNGVVEVGGNTTLAGIAKTLMDTFMSENTEAVQHVGSAEIAANFPPTGEKGCTGLTADMISDYSCKEENGNYIITLTLNSSEENPDDGTMGQNLVDIVEEKQITDAAGSFVSLSGYQNQCIASTVTATIEKESGKMMSLSVYNPTYMCFGKATAMSIITVENCKLGLLYEQEWTVEW